MAVIAAPFKLHNRHDEDIGEFNIEYNDQKNSLNKLIEFCKEYPDRRINLEFIQKVDVNVLSVLAAVHDNVAVRLRDSDCLYAERLAELGYKFFFDVGTFSAYNYTVLDSLIELGVSDVYIADDLWYNILQVKELLESHNIKIRLVLNRIPSTAFNAGKNPRSPIFRPQDYTVLNEVVDVFEFDCGEKYDWHMFDVLLRSWRDRKWLGDLREINRDLQFFYPNESVIFDINLTKLQCGHRCTTRPNQPCRKCEQFIEIGNDFYDKGIRFLKDKDEDES